MKERKEQMDNYRELLKFSIDYAIENNTFHSLNIINNTECLCIWGAGDFLYVHMSVCLKIEI